jgi:metal-responsive CopG/Arc/MetJ family transcriptional regulator
MRVRTSIKLSDSLLKEVDEMIDHTNNRTVFIEEAIREHIERNRKSLRDRDDLDLINNFADDLNAEAEDVLSYQVET